MALIGVMNDLQTILVKMVSFIQKIYDEQSRKAFISLECDLAAMVTPGSYERKVNNLIGTSCKLEFL